ncbi:MAG TPA: alpha/beta hydrolase [Candidatus Norongarragalinales archaeon]|jgi:hypothetical protein|nr:alpha/beta hydrolase [Candidatus Norongarragalinales archaeon]
MARAEQRVDIRQEDIKIPVALGSKGFLQGRIFRRVKVTKHEVTDKDGNKKTVTVEENDNAPFVVHFPGITTSMESAGTRKFIRALNDDGMNVAVVDQRGHGKTLLPLNVPQMIRDVGKTLHYLKKEKGIDRAYIHAHSFAAPIVVDGLTHAYGKHPLHELPEIPQIITLAPVEDFKNARHMKLLYSAIRHKNLPWRYFLRNVLSTHFVLTDIPGNWKRKIKVIIANLVRGRKSSVKLGSLTRVKIHAIPKEAKHVPRFPDAVDHYEQLIKTASLLRTTIEKETRTEKVQRLEKSIEALKRTATTKVYKRREIAQKIQDIQKQILNERLSALKGRPHDQKMLLAFSKIPSRVAPITAFLRTNDSVIGTKDKQYLRKYGDTLDEAGVYVNEMPGGHAIDSANLKHYALMIKDIIEESEFEKQHGYQRNEIIASD